MRAPISVVIPTLNSAGFLPALFDDLIEGLQAGLIHEVIVSDGGSCDQTEKTTDQAGGIFITGAPSRGGQLRAGCAAAGGEWLLILHSDTRLPPGWSDAVMAHMQMGRQKMEHGAMEHGAMEHKTMENNALKHKTMVHGAMKHGKMPPAAAFKLKFAALGFAPWFVAGWANVRSRVFSLPYGDQGLLIARPVYDHVGGYRDVPLMEDVMLARALPRITLLPMAVTTGAGRYLDQGWMRRGAKNLWLLMQYYFGAAPKDLAEKYTRR